MDYNSLMKGTRPHADVLRLIRFAAFLWIGYLIVLALISQSFPGPQRADLFYYVSLGYIALLCLGLAYWPWIQGKLKQAFVPVVITIITVMPVIVNHLMGRLSPLGPRFETPEGSVLAMFPFLFIALLLVAWQYKWQYILLVILGIAGLNFGMIWPLTGPGAPPLMGGLIITLI